MAEYIETYRRGAPEPPEEPAPTGSTEALPDIPEPTVPVAEERAAVSSGLPAAIVFGFAGLILFILAAGTYQVMRVRRAEAAVAPGAGGSAATGEQPPDRGNPPES